MMLRVLLLFFFVSSSSFATTWIVDDDGKADFNNIQEAVNAAQDGDDILVMPGTYTNSGDAVFNTFGKQLWIHSSSGSSKTIIDGGGVRRGAIFNNDETSNTIIEGLTIANCFGIFGGGIFCSYSNPTIRDCDLVSNIAQFGAGAYLIGGNPTFNDCTFENNLSTVSEEYGGGGLFTSSCNLVLTNCSFINNSATNGGGIYSDDFSELTILDCNFTSNTARGTSHGPGPIGHSAGFGGGVYCWQSKATTTNCTFDFNTALGVAGAIYLVGDDLSISSCSFNSNTAWDAGAILCAGSPMVDVATASIYESQFTNNVAIGLDGHNTSGTGGAITLHGDFEISFCDFNGNSAAYSGGGVVALDYTSDGEYVGLISGCTFENNSASTNGDIENVYTVGGIEIVGGWGAGNGNIIITDTILCGNTPSNINGSWIDDGSNCQSFSCEDSDDDGWPNECFTVDDGLHLVPEEYSTIQLAIETAGNGDEILVSPGTYTSNGNSVINTGGKRLWIHSSDGPSDTIIDGEATRRVIHCGSGETSQTIIEGFTIFNGYDIIGAGMYCEYSSPIITNCEFSLNVAEGQGGGLLNNYANPTLNNCVFSLNIAEGQGGGLLNIYANPTLNNCVFSANSSKLSHGGGAYNHRSNTTFNDCLFINNSAGLEGGGVCNDQSSVDVSASTFSNNIAGGWGGGMFSYLSSVEIEESQFSDNSAEDGGGIYFFVSEGDKNPKSITSTLVCGNTLDQIYGEWTDNGGNTIEDVCPDDCPDVNDDGVVDVLDLLFVISDWNTCADNCDGDVNGDGTVDINDLLIVVAAWGPCE